MTPDDFSALLTTTEAARWLGLSASTLAKARVAGGGPPYVKLGSAVRYRRADLEAYAKARRRRSTSQALGL